MDRGFGDAGLQKSQGLREAPSLDYGCSQGYDGLPLKRTVRAYKSGATLVCVHPVQHRWRLRQKHQLENVMIDLTAAITILGFFGVIGTVIIAIRWLDKRHREDLSELKKEVNANSERLNNVESALVGVQTELKAHSERFDRMDERFDRQDERFDRQDERFDRQDERHRILEGKVDRVQGSLDVLIHGYRYTPVVTERERAERERQVGESIGD